MLCACLFAANLENLSYAEVFLLTDFARCVAHVGLAFDYIFANQGVIFLKVYYAENLNKNISVM